MFCRRPELLAPAKRIQSGCVRLGSNSQPLAVKTKCLAYELNSVEIQRQMRQKKLGTPRVYTEGTFVQYNKQAITKIADDR